jgi:hypothetical protein
MVADMWNKKSDRRGGSFGHKVIVHFTKKFRKKTPDLQAYPAHGQQWIIY